MAELSRPDLDYRLKQQKILSEFGVEALRADDLGRLLQRATELCADGMSAQFCKALEYKPGRDTLLVIAGVGWGRTSSATPPSAPISPLRQATPSRPGSR